MTAPTCDQCRGPLFPVDLMSNATVCCDCAIRAIERAQQSNRSEWDIFVAAIREAAVDNTVRANDIRPLIRGRIFHKSIGRLYRRAAACKLLVEIGREESKDSAGRNTHHDSGVYRVDFGTSSRRAAA